MLHRLLSLLDSPRRHLIFLVSLLVLVFALTGIVAYRALEADRSRNATILDLMDLDTRRALGEFASVYRGIQGQFMSALGEDVVSPAWRQSSMDPDSLLVAARALDPACDCVSGAFVHDVKTNETRSAGEFQEDFVSAALGTLPERMDSAHMAAGTVGAALHHVADDGPVVIFGYGHLSDDETTITRLIGLVLSSSSFERGLNLMWPGAVALTGVAQIVGRADTLYMAAAHAGSRRVWGEEFDGGYSLRPTHPIAGLEMRVALRRDLLASAYDGSTRRLAVIGLFILIGGLLVLAAIQIRRETMLMRLRADFVSSVSHELRTPLAQIRMFVETLLLGRTRTDLERQRSLEIIEQEARRLSHLVENVLLFSKTDGGRMPKIAPEPTDFAGDIRRAVDSFSLLSRARDAEVRAELQENIVAHVDRGALRQILINLIDNALKYGPTGQRVLVGAALFDDAARVWVDDEGPGIPEEMRERVFDSFYRLPREMQASIAGSGIGLSVVRELARLHGGKAWAETAPGGGARIVVEFPDAYLRSASAAGSFAAAS